MKITSGLEAMPKAHTLLERLGIAALWLCVAACQKQAAESPCPPSTNGLASGGSESASAGNGSAVGGTSLAPAAAGGSAKAGNAGTDATAGGGGAPVTGMPDASACSAFSLEACATHTDCQVLSGRRVSVEPPCLEADKPLACGTSQGCVAAPVRATDNQGSDWIFATSCVPAGFNDATATGTRFDDCPPEAMGGTGGHVGGGNSFPAGAAGTGGSTGSGGGM